MAHFLWGNGKPWNCKAIGGKFGVGVLTQGAKMAERNGYSGVQIGLHWVIAGLIIYNYFLPNRIGRAFNAVMKGEAIPEGSNALIHTYVGGVVFALVLIRLIVRLRRGVPGRAGEGMIYRLGEAGHWLLYALMIAVPALGAISWYGLVEATAELHEIAAQALIVVALIHALAALFHQYVLKDRLLLRMMKAG
jgi:cytochrome b561